jgi:hypothetical protein
LGSRADEIVRGEIKSMMGELKIAEVLLLGKDGTMERVLLGKQ